MTIISWSVFQISRHSNNSEGKIRLVSFSFFTCFRSFDLRGNEALPKQFQKYCSTHETVQELLVEIYNNYHVETLAAMAAVQAWYLVALRQGGRYRVNKDMRRLVGQVIWASLDTGAFSSFSEPEPKPKRAVLVCFYFCVYLFVFVPESKGNNEQIRNRTIVVGHVDINLHKLWSENKS